MAASARNLEVNAHEAIRLENAMQEERAVERGKCAAEKEERCERLRARRAALEDRAKRDASEERRDGEEGVRAGAAQKYTHAAMLAVDKVHSSGTAVAVKHARAEVRARARDAVEHQARRAAMEERRAGGGGGAGAAQQNSYAAMRAETEHRRGVEQARRAAMKQRRAGGEWRAGAEQEYSHAAKDAVDKVCDSRQEAAAKRARAEVRDGARQFKQTMANSQTPQAHTSVVAEQAGQQLRACFAQRPPL